MKVKKENIKINNGIYNVVPSSFKFAQEIWESESLIDDLDFYVSDDFTLKVKPTTERKKHGKRKTNVLYN